MVSVMAMVTGSEVRELCQPVVLALPELLIRFSHRFQRGFRAGHANTDLFAVGVRA